MIEKYIVREAELTLKKLAEGFPVVAVTGPRQAGKTTLVRNLFGDRPYVSLEDPDNREFARVDPRGFLSRYADGAVFDEAQRVPELFSWLQGAVDGDGRMGRFVLTGSQHFGLMENLTQSLAGRVGTLQLLPLCLPEMSKAGVDIPSTDKALCDGFYPAVHVRRIGSVLWYNNYIQTYLERDVRSMTAVHDLAAFQTFLKLCAGRCGQVLNLSALGAEVGVSHNTARAWLSVLQESFIVFLLQPYHRNYNKRLIRSPKLYFFDSGLAARLLGIRDDGQLALHPLRGALFESFVVSEIVKSFFNRAFVPPCFFWRDSKGQEVDLILEGTELLPVEIKSGITVASDFLDGLKQWRKLASVEKGVLVYGGEDDYIREGIRILPWKRAYALKEEYGL